MKSVCGALLLCLSAGGASAGEAAVVELAVAARVESAVVLVPSTCGHAAAVTLEALQPPCTVHRRAVAVLSAPVVVERRVVVRRANRFVLRSRRARRM
ncbi:MAG: hypothetical protein AB7O62_22935 [Pirellulales bacterium]